MPTAGGAESGVDLHIGRARRCVCARRALLANDRRASTHSSDLPRGSWPDFSVLELDKRKCYYSCRGA
eukprot:3627425-Prymnesium_polylepis.1